MTISCKIKSYCIAVDFPHCLVTGNRVQKLLERLICHWAFLRPKEFLLHGSGSVPVHFKDFLDGSFEQACHLEGQRQAGIILLRFNGIDGLARDAEFVGQIGLRPFLGRAQFAQTIFHLYLRHEKITPIP